MKSRSLGAMAVACTVAVDRRHGPVGFGQSLNHQAVCSANNIDPATPSRRVFFVFGNPLCANSIQSELP
jgi:hypothetical protein